MMPPEGDIVDIVAKTPEVSTLLSLVQQAGIAQALKGKGHIWLRQKQIK